MCGRSTRDGPTGGAAIVAVPQLKMMLRPGCSSILDLPVNRRVCAMRCSQRRGLQGTLYGQRARFVGSVLAPQSMIAMRSPAAARYALERNAARAVAVPCSMTIRWWFQPPASGDDGVVGD